MPIFEYSCNKCESEFELLVRSVDKPECPDCGSPKLDKLMSSSAGRVKNGSLPIANGCPPSDAPPCNPNCCRL